MDIQPSGDRQNEDNENSSVPLDGKVMGTLGGYSKSSSGTVSQPIFDDNEEGWTPAKVGRRKKSIKNKRAFLEY